jgi:hypothetical protein
MHPRRDRPARRDPTARKPSNPCQPGSVTHRTRDTHVLGLMSARREREGQMVPYTGNGAAFIRSMLNRLLTFLSGTAPINLR